MRLRDFSASDLEQVLYLHRVAMEELGAYKGEGVWDDDLKDIENFYKKEVATFIVIEIEGRIVAMGAFKPSSNNFAEVKRMRVLPAFQKKGFGKLLYAELEKRARAFGYEGFHLETSDLQEAAQMLYVKVGFVEYDRVVIDGFNCILYRKIF